MANLVLALFLLTFWVFVWVFIKVDNLIHRRPFRGGPSLIPLFPFVPIACFAVGWLLNLGFAPAGTIVIVALHLGYLIYAVVAAYRRPPSR